MAKAKLRIERIPGFMYNFILIIYIYFFILFCLNGLMMHSDCANVLYCTDQMNLEFPKLQYTQLAYRRMNGCGETTERVPNIYCRDCKVDIHHGKYLES